MAKTKLGRPARGLPRFFLDCGWHQHHTWIGAPIEVLAVFPAMVGSCTVHATDGVLPADVETLSLALGVRARHVRKAVDWMIAHDKVTVDGEALVLAGWAEHNPTAVEVERATVERSQSGSWGNHKRWHVDRGVVALDCVHCASPDPPNDRYSDRYSDPIAIAKPSHGMGWDGMGSNTSSTTDSNALRSEPVTDDPTPPDDRGSLIWAQRLAATVGAHSRLTDEQIRTELLTAHHANPTRSDADLIADLEARSPA